MPSVGLLSAAGFLKTSNVDVGGVHVMSDLMKLQRTERSYVDGNDTEVVRQVIRIRLRMIRRVVGILDVIASVVIEGRVGGGRRVGDVGESSSMASACLSGFGGGQPPKFHRKQAERLPLHLQPMLG